MSHEINPPDAQHRLSVDVADTEVFSEIRRLVNKALLRICPEWLMSEVDDLVQEAMIKLVRMQQASDQPLEINKTYIKRMAHSITIDEIRKRQRRPESGTQAGGEADQVEDIPHNPSVQQQTADAIRDCVSQQLPDRQRVLSLHLLGHTVTEVAQILGCKVKRAENMVYRGIKQLRECLQSKGVHP